MTTATVEGLMELADKYAYFYASRAELEAYARALAAPADTKSRGTALERFSELAGDEETDPIERLRFFCSMAMSDRDWLDAEPFFDAIDALAAPADSAPVAWRWQPIETAPKNGEPILLGYFLEAGGGGDPEVARWHGTKQTWCGRVLLNAEGYFSPTHWMPLPPDLNAAAPRAPAPTPTPTNIKQEIFEAAVVAHGVRFAQKLPRPDIPSLEAIWAGVDKALASPRAPAPDDGTTA